MNVRILTGAIALLVASSITLCAPDFDADSIYYTPIPKVKPTEQSKRGSYATEDQFVEQTRKPNPFAAGVIRADSVTSEKFIQYFFNVQVGSLIGCTDCIADKEVSFTASTVHGITIGNKLRVGGGLGFDSYYSWQTVPFFGSVSWDLLGTKNTNALFIQCNYGWSSPWRTEKAWEYGQTSVDGGQMFYGMAGVRLKYYDLRLSFSVGGKVQEVYTYIDSPTFYYDINGNPISGTSSTTTIAETMKRFAVTITIGWK
jgi:hypothetical protein